jgi:alpha-galactosidase
MWRISDDFWDQWKPLYEQFKRLHDWTPHRGPGHWPDADMLPLGNIRAMEKGNDWTRFTTNEQRTLMTMWSIARSPLMMGGHMPNNDAFTLSLLTNREVLAVNQASLNNRQLFRRTTPSRGRPTCLVRRRNTSRSSTPTIWISTRPSAVLTAASSNVPRPVAPPTLSRTSPGAKKLYLVVTDGGDKIDWDHADWGLARLTKPDGSFQWLSELGWVSATCGWKPQPQKNQSIEGQPLRINGVTMDHGIGTHAPSVIAYDLPPGFTEFRALAGLDDEINGAAPNTATSATVRFLLFTNAPTGRTIEVFVHESWHQRTGRRARPLAATRPRHVHQFISPAR